MVQARAEGYEPTTEELSIVSSATTGLARSGLEPDEAGQILLEGILAGKFWICSHSNWVEGPLKRRYEAMIDNGELYRL